MTMEQHLTRLGGIATKAELVRLTSRKEFERALAAGRIVRTGRGRYALPFVDEGLKAAHALSGVASHGTAAGHWGWAMKTAPELPVVTVPRKRVVRPTRRVGVHVVWSDLGVEDVAGGVTSMSRTLIDCLRTLPFDEALCIADSALRSGSLTKPQLVQLARACRGNGAVQARRVAEVADARAANPFEWHGKRRALTRDCERNNNFALLGWTILRFSWEHVMLNPLYVDEVLTEFVRRRTGTLPRHSV